MAECHQRLQRQDREERQRENVQQAEEVALHHEHCAWLDAEQFEQQRQPYGEVHDNVCKFCVFE